MNHPVLYTWMKPIACQNQYEYGYLAPTTCFFVLSGLRNSKLNTLQDIIVADQFATTEILAVRKYGEIEQKPSHFGRHRK